MRIAFILLILSLRAAAAFIGTYEIIPYADRDGSVIRYYDAQGVAYMEEEFHGEVIAGYRPVAPSPRLLSIAEAFRTVLRLHFGEGAETNTDITAESVAQYFLDRRLTGAADPNDAADMIILREGFEAIKAFTLTGESWSFFHQHWEAEQAESAQQ